MTEKKVSFIERAGDGCHRWGWLITLMLNLLFLAYFVGRIEERIDGMSQRVGRLEQQWDVYLKDIRGIEIPAPSVFPSRH